VTIPAVAKPPKVKRWRAPSAPLPPSPPARLPVKVLWVAMRVVSKPWKIAPPSASPPSPLASLPLNVLPLTAIAAPAACQTFGPPVGAGGPAPLAPPSGRPLPRADLRPHG
jgi:hypothetical protein